MRTWPSIRAGQTRAPFVCTLRSANQVIPAPDPALPAAQRPSPRR